MDKYFSANELLERWNREDFQLFDLCKELKLQAYNKFGKRMVDPNSCEKTKKLSYEVILYLMRMREGPKPEGDDLRRRITEEIKRKNAREIYDSQPLDTPIIPEGCVGFDFRLPNNATKAKEKMTEFMRFFFKEKDIKRYEIDHDLYYPDREVAKNEKEDISSADIQDDTTEEDFVEEIDPSIIGKDYVFRRIGKNWFIKFKEKSASFQDFEKIRYIAYLLDNPDKPIHALGLYYAVKQKTVSFFTISEERLKPIC